MKKTLFIILALCSMSYGLSGYSMYKTYVAKDTVTHINLDSNFYRGVNWSNKLADTIDRNFIRWYDFNSHDSTLRYFKVDTIRSNPHVDSIAGNTVITGAPIVTGALTVDSLKSTKGINATGGTFSGRITGSDVEVSDSIKGVTGTFSGALTGATLNTGNGANELYPMDQDQRTTASPTHVLGTYTDGVRSYNATSEGTYIGLFKKTGSLPEYPSKNFPVLKTDYDYLFFSTLNKFTGAVGAEYFGVRDTADPAKLKFLVYHDTTTARIIKANSIKLGTGSYLKTYVEGSFPCTLKTSDVTVQQVVTANYTKIGNVLTIFLREIFYTSNSVNLKLYCTLPFIPKNNLASGSVRGYDAGTPISLTYEWRSGSPTYIEFKRYDNVVFTTSGVKGVSQSPIIYITE